MKKIVSVLVILTLFFQTNANTLASGIFDGIQGEEKIFFGNDNQNSEYIVQLSKKPVYSYSDVSTVSSKNSVFSKTAEIASQQTKVEKSLKQNFSGIDIEYRYNQVFNGFAINATEAQIEKIKNMPDVVNVYKTNYFYPDLEESEEPENTDAVPIQIGEEINVEAMYNDISSGLRFGEGNIIAVIDAGFDINHEAFALSDQSKALLKSKNDVADFINKDLAIGDITVNQVYKSSKIPFAYDYANGDADVYLGNQSHGTHVAGIVSANCNNLKGLSPESQLILMKVANDTGLINDATLLAALDDAVKLGVDCINMSIGGSNVNCAKEGLYYEVIENLKTTKTQLFVAAGNEGFGNKKLNKAFPSEVNYASGGMPAGYSGAQAVGNAYAGTSSIGNSWQMNRLSSYLTNEYLDNCVTISAPGTSIYSSVNDDKYAKKSGTSMASPTICGAYSIAKTWFLEKFPEYSFATPYDLKTKIFTMMQNTADPMQDYESHFLYTPRYQGAGLINLEDMTNAKVIVSSPETGEGMSFIGDTQNNSFTFDVNIENLSDSAITYNSITAKSIIDNVSSGMIVGSKEYDAEFELPTSITVSPNSTETFSVTVSLSDAQREELDGIFSNGFFLDGFLFLGSTDNTLEEITYPFTSFIGDWNKAPIIDDGYYEQNSLYGGTYFLYYNQKTHKYYPGGYSLLDKTIDKENIAFSTKGNMYQDGYIPCFSTMLLRPADRFELLVDGTSVLQTSGIQNYTGINLNITSFIDRLPEGQHSFAVKATNLNGCTQTITNNFYIDDTAPKVIEMGLVDDKLTILIKENSGVNLVSAEGEEGKEFASITKVGENTYQAVFDSLPYSENNLYMIYIVDNAFNELEFPYSPNSVLYTNEGYYREYPNGYSFSYIIINTSPYVQTFVPVLGIYNDHGTLTDLYECDTSTLDIGGYGELEINLETSTRLQTGYKSRLYLFDSINDLKPLSPKWETIE